MINLNEIDKAILDLENHDTTFATCEKLAWLYIVRDHLTQTEKSIEITSERTDSDFLIASSRVPISNLLEILNEHMQVIKVLIPKEYDAVITKINKLK